MTGLEKILQAIASDTKANAEGILAQANREAEEILTSAKAQAESKCTEIAAKSEQDIKSVFSRAESSAALLEKKLILDAKQFLIGDVITKAREKLLNLPDNEYFNVILQIVKRQAYRKPGKIRFSSDDLKRLPKDFVNTLKDTLSSVQGASLTVDSETAVLDGGFILIYGDIEENCSFEALFSAAKDELQDKVNAFLFE